MIALRTTPIVMTILGTVLYFFNMEAESSMVVWLAAVSASFILFLENVVGG